MKLKDLTKEELEAMSYDDIAMMILEESKKQMKVNELFKKVCETLGLTDDEFVEKLPAFFDVLSTDHRFIMLENGLWDLKTRHSTKIVIDQDDEEEDEIIEIEDEPEEEKEDENIYADEDDQDDDLTDDGDDLKDLVIIEEDEEQMV
jgi:DNA-directed RNA polymerase subunit delta